MPPGRYDVNRRKKSETLSLSFIVPKIAFRVCTERTVLLRFRFWYVPLRIRGATRLSPRSDPAFEIPVQSFLLPSSSIRQPPQTIFGALADHHRTARNHRRISAPLRRVQALFVRCRSDRDLTRSTARVHGSVARKSISAAMTSGAT